MKKIITVQNGESLREQPEDISARQRERLVVFVRRLEAIRNKWGKE